MSRSDQLEGEHHLSEGTQADEELSRLGTAGNQSVKTGSLSGRRSSHLQLLRTEKKNKTLVWNQHWEILPLEREETERDVKGRARDGVTFLG